MRRGDTVTTMTGVTIFRGPCHVIEFQSELFIQLAGPLMGLPAREALAEERHRRYFRILSDVYHTGVEVEAKTQHGVLWFFRSQADPECVVAHLRQPALLRPESPQEPDPHALRQTTRLSGSF